MTPAQLRRKEELHLLFKDSLSMQNSPMTQDLREELAELLKIEKEEDIERFGKRNYTWMVELLYKHDPIHLIPCGVPKEEYEREARIILRALDASFLAGRRDGLGTPRLSEILSIVHAVFSEKFGREAEQMTQEYFSISQEIYFNLDRFESE